MPYYVHSRKIILLVTCLNLSLLSVLSINSAQAGNRKAWESYERITINTGIIPIYGSKNNYPRDIVNNFILTGRIQERQARPRLGITREKHRTPVGGKSIIGEFKGACSESVAIDVKAVDIRSMDFSKFDGSQKGEDLPPDVHKMIDSMRIALVDQCENIRVIRVKFESGLYRDEFGRMNSHKYAGTIMADNGWKMGDGNIKTKYDATQTVSIHFRDITSVLGVRYEGKCEKNPIITLGPLFHNNQERRFHKRAKMFDYRRAAREFTTRYVAACPNAETISYKMKPLPRDRKCANGQGNDCMLLASRKSAWSIDTTSVKFSDPSGPIQSAADMTKYLAAGDRKIMRAYRSDYSLYTEFFLSSYSDHCRSLIRNPVTLKISLIEYTRRGDGTTSNHRQTGVPKLIHVEREYASLFKRVASRNKAIGVNKILRLTLENRKRGMPPGRDAAMAVGSLAQMQRDVGSIVSRGCSGQSVQAAYKNLLKL